MAIQKTEALVLRRFPIRETSLIAVFFSPTHGKFHGILKGIRRDPRKFASSVDLFTVNEVVFYPSRHSSLHLISQCTLLRSALPETSKEGFTVASRLMELIDRISPVHQPNPDLYRLALETLRLVPALGPSRLIRAFEIKLLNLSGFKPHLRSCVRCGYLPGPQDPAWFSHREGGLVCSRCQVSVGDAVRVSSGLIRAIQTIERLPMESAVEVGLMGGEDALLTDLVSRFVDYHCS